MERISVFTISKEYLRRRGRDLRFAPGLFASFCLSLPLPGAPGAGALRRGFWSGSWALFMPVWDFRRFLRRHRALEQLRQSAAPSWRSCLRPGTFWNGITRSLWPSFSRSGTDPGRSPPSPAGAGGILHALGPPGENAHRRGQAAFETGAGGEEASQLELELFKIERYVEMVLQYLRVESPSARSGGSAPAA